MRHQLMQAYIYIYSARSSKSEMMFHSLYIGVQLIRNFSKSTDLLYELLSVNYFLFIIVCSGIVGTGVTRPADMLGSEVSDTQFGDCYIMTVLCDVT